MFPISAAVVGGLFEEWLWASGHFGGGLAGVARGDTSSLCPGLCVSEEMWWLLCRRGPGVCPLDHTHSHYGGTHRSIVMSNNERWKQRVFKCCILMLFSYFWCSWWGRPSWDMSSLNCPSLSTVSVSAGNKNTLSLSGLRDRADAPAPHWRHRSFTQTQFVFIFVQIKRTSPTDIDYKVNSSFLSLFHSGTSLLLFVYINCAVDVQPLMIH